MTHFTLSRLQELVSYDPSTGIFTRLQDKRGGVKRGDVAGSVNIDGYITLMIDRKACQGHRLAWFYMTGEWPKGEIDHINRNKTDNRFANLRVVNRVDNCRNKSRPRNNTSGTPGVTFSRNKWVARIGVEGKYVRLGCFDNKAAAVAVRRAAERYFGYHANHGVDP